MDKKKVIIIVVIIVVIVIIYYWSKQTQKSIPTGTDKTLASIPASKTVNTTTSVSTRGTVTPGSVQSRPIL